MPAVAPIVSNIALNLAIGVGASLLAGVFRPQQAQNVQRVTSQRGLTFELEVGESVAVSSIFGLGRASGQLLYVNEFGTDNEFIQFTIKAGHGWHDGLEHFLVDEKPVTLVGSNADARGRSVAEFTREGTPYLWVKHYTGAPGQTADAELVARANPAGRWTANHKVTGCAYMIITVRYDADFFGSTVPRFGSVWRGLRLFDWRVPGAIWGDQSTYVFTKNPAVIRYNFRRGIWVNGVRVLGQGFSSYANDLAGYTAAANRCDETFLDPVSETTFPVYEFGRQISDNEEKLAVLRELDDAYCGSSFKRGGADVPLPAQQLVSVMTLADIDRLGGKPIRIDRKGSVSQKKTMWHGQFVSHDLGWTESPFTPRIDTDLESLIGGRRAATMNQPYESVQERAQLRAEVALRRQFYPATRVETFTPKALVLEPGDAVLRTCEWGSMLMVVEKTDPLPEKTGVTVTLTEWNNVIVPASGDSFVELPSGAGAGQANPDRTIAVSGLSVVAFQREGGGAVHPHARANWTQITDPNVDQVLIRVWPSAGTEDDDKQDFFASSRLQSNLVFGPLQPEIEYTYRAIPIRRDGRVCVWTNPGVFTTGPQEVPVGPVDIDQFNEGLQDLIERTASSVRDVREAVQRVNLLVANFASRDQFDKQELRQNLVAAIGANTAEWSHQVDLLAAADQVLGARIETVELSLDGKAGVDITDALFAQVSAVEGGVDINAQAITDLRGVVGYESGEATFRLYMDYAPSAGFTNGFALQARVDSGFGWRDIGIYGEVNASLGRIILNGDQVVIKAGVSIAALFESGTTYIDNARIHNLTADQIDVEDLLASSAFINNLNVTNANIENLSVTRLKIADGAVSDFDVQSSTSAAAFTTSISRNGPTVTAPTGPFIAAVQARFTTSTSGETWSGLVAIYRDDITAGTSTQLTSYNVNNQPTVSINYTFVDMWTAGNSIRYRITVLLTPSGGASMTSSLTNYFIGSTIARK